MRNTKEFDVVVVGGGSGLTAAFAAVEDGKSVAVIEAREAGLGGTCVHRGCIPTKALIEAADFADRLRDAERLGFRVDPGGVWADFPALMEGIRRKRTLDAADVKSSVEKEMFAFYGKARFVDDRTLELEDGRVVRGQTVFVATGARAAVPAVQGLTDSGYWTNDDILELKSQPGHVIVLGGGYVGTELAYFLSAMGTRVTVVERGMCLEREDREVRALFNEEFARRVELRTGSTAVRVSRSNGMVGVEVRRGDEERTELLRADGLLVATGRQPNTDGLELACTGVNCDEGGWIRTNEHLQTSNPQIFAFGDVIGRGMFKHTSGYEGRLAYRNSQGGRRRVSYKRNPRVVFTQPRVAAVGHTEQECKRRRLNYRAVRRDYASIAKGRIIGEPPGFAKLLVDPATDVILGFHVVGPHAQLLLHEVVVAMNAGDGTAAPVRRAIHVHPTLSELVAAVFADAD